MSSVLTVSQLNKYVGFKLSQDIKLKGVAVKGEISNFTCHYKTGHLYFTLNDACAQVKAVMFASAASKLRFEPDDGLSVLAVGNVELYEKGGQYQIIVNELVPMGQGKAAVSLEELKRKLVESGVINENNKKPIPLVPKMIAVVTSAGAAALRDILNITGRRYPLCKIEVYTALVQGEKSPLSISRALEAADKSGADTIILARGGGSAEDLSSFNTEEVAFAIHKCKTPVVSAVGHETDTTIADLTADMRAPTPSAAAELCTPDRQEIISSLSLFDNRLRERLEILIADKQSRLDEYSARLRASSPVKRLEAASDKLSYNTEKLTLLINSRLVKSRGDFELVFSKLQALSPFGVLERGYSIVSKDGRTIDDASELTKGDTVMIRFKNTCAKAQIQSTDKVKE